MRNPTRQRDGASKLIAEDKESARLRDGMCKAFFVNMQAEEQIRAVSGLPAATVGLDRLICSDTNQMGCCDSDYRLVL